MDNKKVAMKIKEIKRVEVMALIDTGKITGIQATKMMGISLRQTRRVIKKYSAGGAESLVIQRRARKRGERIMPGGRENRCEGRCCRLMAASITGWKGPVFNLSFDCIPTIPKRKTVIKKYG